MVRLALALIAMAVAVLAGANVARGEEEGTHIGGEVESTLALSLGEPGPFIRVRAGHKRSVYDATIAVELTATDMPTRLSLADGEAIAGRRRGRLVRGARALTIPLRAAAAGRRYRSLDANVDPVLEQWDEPVASEPATIRLRQTVRGSHPRPLAGWEKLLLVTVTAAGP